MIKYTRFFEWVERRWKIVVFFSLFLLSCLVFRDLPKTYFQADEWFGFGKAFFSFSQSWIYYFQNLSWYHITPLNVFVFFYFVKWFSLNASAYFWIAIAWHSLNAFLLFQIVFSATRNRVISLSSAALFLVNGVSSQGVTWVGTSVGTLGNASLAFGSILYFIVFLQEGKKSAYYLSIILFVLSLGFKESSVFLVPFFLILAYFVASSGSFLDFLKAHALIFLAGIVVGFSRVLPIFLDFGGGSGNIGGVTSISQVIWNGVLYPLEGLSQTFVPYGVYYRIQNLIRPDAEFWLSKTALGMVPGDWLSVGLSVVFIAILICIWKYFLKGKERLLLVFSSVYVFLSFLPYVIVLKGSSYLDSRYYYLAAAGAGVVFSLAIFGISRFLASYPIVSVDRKRLLYISFFILYTPFSLLHAFYVQNDISKLFETSSVRKRAVSFVQKHYPTIGEKTIFYVESDSSYYGLAEKIPPFQSGFGQMLMVIFSDKGQLNSKFFENDFLWDIRSEGYLERDGQGFGYFRDIQSVRDALEKHHLSPENVYALRFDGGKARNITDETRRRLQFSSDEKLLENIAHGEDLSSRERFVYFDLKNDLATQENELIGAQATGLYRDKLYTAKLFTHAGWIGANLVHYQDGFSGDTLIIPGMLYGYDIVSVGSVGVNTKSVVVKRVRKLPNNEGWEVLIDKQLVSDDMVEFGLWVAVRQVDIEGGKKISLAQYDPSDIQGRAKTTLLQSKIPRRTNTFVLRGNGKMGSLPMNNLRMPIVFVNGIMTTVASVSIIAPDILQITLDHDLVPGDKVEAPIFVGE